VIGEAFEQAVAGAPELALTGLAGTEDLREALSVLARGWVVGITRPEVTDLRLLVISVTRQFPELARNWLQGSPRRFAPVIAAALRDLSDRGVLGVPDPHLAVIQFYALTVYRPGNLGRAQPAQQRRAGRVRRECPPDPAVWVSSPATGEEDLAEFRGRPDPAVGRDQVIVPDQRRQQRPGRRVEEHRPRRQAERHRVHDDDAAVPDRQDGREHHPGPGRRRS